MSFESQVSASSDATTVKSASLNLASLRTLEEIKAAFSELSKEEAREFFHHVMNFGKLKLDQALG